jgi:hypothetical protein
LTTGSLSISSSNSTSITYTDNRCSGRGGTVSWTKDPAADAGTYSAYDIINFNRIIYSNNSAIFGSNTSTQATSLVFAGGNLSLVNDYYSVLMPHPTVHLLDYFSAKDVSDSSAVVTATVVTSSCLGHVGYLSGITTATSSLGDAVFTGLTAFCYPGGHMTLKYTGKKHRFTPVPRIMTRSTLIVPLYHCEYVNCPKPYSTLTLPFSPASRSGHSLQHRDAELLRVPTVR